MSDEANQLPLTRKLTAADRDANREYLRSIWTLMIAYGSAPVDQQAHGSLPPFGAINIYHKCVDADLTLTRRVAEALAEHGFDETTCTDPVRDKLNVFTDTANSWDESVEFLLGKMRVETIGDVWWAMTITDDHAFSRLLALIVADTDFDTALDTLQARLDEFDTRPNNSFSPAFSSSLPTSL